MNPFQVDVYRHHQPITGDDITPRIIKGLDGAFRERCEQGGLGVSKPTVGVVLQLNTAGVVIGSRMVKFGSVQPKEINTLDVWPDAEGARLVIPNFDLSIFEDFNGLMSTPYAELPFKVMVKAGETWKTLKKGEMEGKGYGELSFRLHCRAIEPEKVKFTVVAVPGSLAQLSAHYGDKVASRGFPGIKIVEGRAKLVSKEERRFGLGIEPFFMITNPKTDEQGEIVTDNLRFPASMVVKGSVVGVLQSGVMPNWHAKRGQFEEAIKAKNYSKRMAEFSWPDPIQEDDNETSSSEPEEGELDDD